MGNERGVSNLRLDLRNAFHLNSMRNMYFFKMGISKRNVTSRKTFFCQRNIKKEARRTENISMFGKQKITF